MTETRNGEQPEITTYVRENRDVIANVLRHSQDSYARACALALLMHGGTSRDVESVKQEVEEIC
jgi:hypothetical protein